MVKTIKKHTLTIIIFLIILNIAIFFRLNLPEKEVVGSDFDAIYTETQKMLKGESIYSRILTGSLTDQFAGGYGKYPVLFPSVYYGMAVFSGFGKIDVGLLFKWLQIVILFSDFITSFIIFKVLNKSTGSIVAFVGVIFWLFNRWASNGYFGGAFDPIAFMFLAISTYNFKKLPVISAIFLAISILVKHFGLFVLPLYTIIWFREYGIGRAIKYASIVVAPLFIISIPSLVRDYKGFFYSIMFNFTRKQDEDFFLPFMDQISYQAYQQKNLSIRFLTLMINRVYFLGSYFLILLVPFYKKISAYQVILLVFAWFFLFHSKAFAQYNIWLVGAIILSFAETFKEIKNV